MEELERQCPSFLRFISLDNIPFIERDGVEVSLPGYKSTTPIDDLDPKFVPIVDDIFKCLDSKENWQDLIFNVGVKDCKEHGIDHLFASYIFRRYEKNDIDLGTILTRALLSKEISNTGIDYYAFMLLVMIANKDLSDDVISMLELVIKKYGGIPSRRRYN